jgi:hypothetical protein
MVLGIVGYHKPEGLRCRRQLVESMRYRTLLEEPVGEWEDGHGVVQIVSPVDEDAPQLRFAYYTDGEFVNRPLTLAPDDETADATAEAVQTMAKLARTFTADEIEALVEDLGADRVLELAVLVDELGRSRLADILTAE